MFKPSKPVDCSTAGLLFKGGFHVLFVWLEEGWESFLKSKWALEPFRVKKTPVLNGNRLFDVHRVRLRYRKSWKSPWSLSDLNLLPPAWTHSPIRWDDAGLCVSETKSRQASSRSSLRRVQLEFRSPVCSCDVQRSFSCIKMFDFMLLSLLQPSALTTGLFFIWSLFVIKFL